MSRFGFFVKEAFRALRRNPAPSVAAIVTTIVTVVLLGVLIPVFQKTQGKSQEVRSQLEEKVFLYPDASRAQITALKRRIQGLPHVRSVAYISPSQALRILQSRLHDKSLLAELNSNPLPPSFNVKPDDASQLTAIQNSLAPSGRGGKPHPISPLISSVKQGQEAAAVEQVTTNVKIILSVLTALLLLGSLLLVGNTIRLSIYARRREVEVMRLVGATRWFIRWPFMIEGVVVGFGGGVIAILILWLGKVIVVDPLSKHFALFAAQHTMSFPLLLALIFSAAMAVTAIGSGITLRRFLKV